MTKTNEYWSEFPLAPTYLVSSLGEVFNTKTNKFLNGSKNDGGYLITGFSSGLGSTITKSIHRVVALTYLPNPNNLPTIDHIDMNKQNNSVDNLRWCSYSLNNWYRKKQKNNMSGYRGLTFHKRDKTWRAKLVKDKKIVFSYESRSLKESQKAYVNFIRGFYPDELVQNTLR
ncbi:MAG: hypothetical protein DRP09_11075 [Candidatus Thorarchaeota archaeon]|nr:MAG: hypothetical protein DRP09_11075 [Candidatus Thorarchaeota archaeon]